MPTFMELEIPAPRLKHAKLVLLMVPLLSKHHRLSLQLLIANALPTFTVLVLFAQLALLLLLVPLLLWLDQPHALVPLVSTGWPLLLLVVLLSLLLVSSALRILPQPLVLLPKLLAVATLAIGEIPRQAMTATQL